MPVPLTPDSPGRSSVWRPLQAPEGESAPSPQNNQPIAASLPAELINQAIQEAPVADESSPTVISSARGRSQGPDLLHAQSLVGRRLGHFELMESVGIGGMAAVIKARDLDLNRIVALKILPPDMATDPENITRFKQEARAAARLDHENIARVYYCGEDQGLHFISFEFVEGVNLRVQMDNHGGSLPVAESLHYLMQVTAGLSHAASRGVVHRDIKPSNIVITPEGKAKIVDMGLARNLDPRSSNGQLTQSGMTLGTFDYISPEQAIEPRSADCRSDIYSLGCTFYHVLTGRTPVPEGTAAKKLHCHQHVAPLDPREYAPEISDELAAILGKMMAKDPEQRYQHPDHLLQHLLIVAKQLKLPADLHLAVNASHPSPYADRPLPAPPGLSLLWVGCAVIVLVLGLFAMTGGFGGPQQTLDSTPFWQNDKGAKEVAGSPKKARDPAPSGSPIDTASTAKGPQEAKNVDELVSLLRQPNPHLRLKAGVVYDLTKVSRKEVATLEAVFEGNNLTIECDRLMDKKPVIRMLACTADDGKSPRPGSFTIRAPMDGSSARVHLRGIRFEIVADDSDANHVGLSILNADQIDIKECSFIPPLRTGFPAIGPAALAIHQNFIKEATPEARVERCWFAPGAVAVDLLQNGSQSLHLTECAFGPQYTIVRADASAGDADERKPAEIRMESCSVLMTRGAVVEIGDQVPCRVTAGWCLFSNPDLQPSEPSRAFLIRQLGAIAPDTRFEGLKTADATPMPNGYQNVLAYANDEHSYTFDECKQQLVPAEDAAARLLTKHPWAEEQPVKRLYDYRRQLKQVFTIDLKQEILRLEPDKNRNLLGVKHLPGTLVYDSFPYPSLTPDVMLANNVKIWQPEFPLDAKLPANVYRSLVKAIDDLNPGDILLIRHDGPLEMDPVEFKKADTGITIRPDDDCRPVLIPKAPTLKKDPALFKLYGGQLILENLLFRLKRDRAPSIVTLPGGGQCTFRNCSATLEEGDDLAVVSLADPRGEMMMMGMTSPKEWPTPRIVIENTFIRGRGRMLTVHGSRPFDVRMKDSLAVLDGSLIGIEPSSAELAEPGPAQVSLDHTTTYLTKHLLTQRASDKRLESKGLGLVQVQIQSTHGLFVPASEQAALISLEHIDSMEQAENTFLWRDGRYNMYGYKPEQVMLQILPDNTDTATLLERIVRDRWVGKWREPDHAFGEVNFSVVPATKRFDGVKPGDFDIKSITPPLKSDFPMDLGAPIDSLRKMMIDE